MFEKLTLPAVNRLLRANGWALDTLRPHAGKTILLSSPPWQLKATVAGDGALVAPAADATSDATVTITPGVLLRMAARDDAAWQEARVTGDVELAAAVDYVRRNLRIDFEEPLSRVFGDVAAHRMAQAVRELDAWGRSTLLNLAQAGAEYATYERPLVASGAELERYSREVDAIRDDAARLDKRIALLARKIDDQPAR